LQLIGHPYLWLAGLDTIRTPLAHAPKVDISVGAGEILCDLNNVPFMGSAELRYGPFGVLADAMHIPSTAMRTRVIPAKSKSLFV
jgi:hypothetical protein